jgi:ankyrin repeat protein
MLLQNGANIEATDATGSTALHMAIKKQNSEIADLRLNSSASLNVKQLSRIVAASSDSDCP